MLRQRVVEDILAVGIFFKQRKIVKRAGEQKHQRHNEYFSMQRPTPQCLNGNATNSVTGGQQYQPHAQPESTAQTGSGQRTPRLRQIRCRCTCGYQRGDHQQLANNKRQYIAGPSRYNAQKTQQQTGHRQSPCRVGADIPELTTFAGHQTIRGIANERQRCRRESKKHQQQQHPIDRNIRQNTHPLQTPLLHPSFLLQVICCDFFRIQPLHGNTGIQLLQRFFIQTGKNRL